MSSKFWMRPGALFLLLGVFWCGLIIASFLNNLKECRNEALKMASIQAESAFITTVYHRAWNASKGGVYVPLSASTPENPYLDLEHKTVETLDGQVLTLVNPAYMTRQVYEQMAEDKTIHGRMISAEPINPANTPDDWERAALAQFENRDIRHVSEQLLTEDGRVIRYAQPLFIKESCLKCHDEQRYAKGDLRGAISLIVSTEPLHALTASHQRQDAVEHVGIGLGGLAFLFAAGWQIGRDQHRKQKLTDELRDKDGTIVQMTQRLPVMVYQYQRDPEGKESLCYCNQSCEELFGVTSEQATKDVHSLYAHINKDDLPGLLKRIQEAEDRMSPFQAEYRVNHPREGQKWIYTAASPLQRDDGSLIWNGYSSDITERKRMERDMCSARDAAESGNRAKSHFLAMMSHEIRTPMNGIIGLVEVLGETPLTDEQHTLVETVRGCADTLMTVLNDVLDYSRLVSGRVELKTSAFDLEKELHSVIDLFSSKATDKGLEVICSYPATLPRLFEGDKVRLRQVVMNLVSNSIKFTEAGHVLLEVTQVDGGRVFMSITDTGIGLDPEALDTLFEPFHQGDEGITRRYGGTGLGLTISLKLIEAMGGSLRGHPVDTGGSRFEMIVPLKVLTDASTPSIKRVAGDKGKVLIVDDNSVNLKVLQEQLLSLDVAVDPVLTPEAGLELVRQNAYSLIITDYMMPEITGGEFAAQVKALDNRKDIPIILLTSAGKFTHVEEGLFTEILNKPLPFQVLRTTLERHLPEETTEEQGQGGEPAAERAKAASGEATRWKKNRILVCEDNPVNQKVIRLLLEKEGLDPVIVSHGKAGIAAMKETEFDLIFMDIEMPIMGGIGAAKQARQTFGERLPPIVALTAAAMDGDRERFLSAGMCNYLPKPLRRHELHVCLVQYLGLASA
jgi:PAS domain S-box-containing protein